MSWWCYYYTVKLLTLIMNLCIPCCWVTKIMQHLNSPGTIFLEKQEVKLFWRGLSIKGFKSMGVKAIKTQEMCKL